VGEYVESHFGGGVRGAAQRKVEDMNSPIAWLEHNRPKTFLYVSKGTGSGVREGKREEVPC
jgi:hypothetical protein